MKEGVDFSYGIKSTVAQCLVLTTMYLLNIQQGIDLMMPTVIIGSMRLNGDDSVPDVTDEQLSWIGSLVYLSPPVGNLILTLFLARVGHRACIALTSFIQVSAVMVAMLFPVTLSTLYACSALMGLSTGFATGLSVSYSGEVCEPKLRGSLTSALNVFYFGGYFFITFAYAVIGNWKTSLLITTVVPVVNIAVLTITPDSPIWLLSKGRTEKAKKVLRKLRGCATEEKCATEFNEMTRYVSQTSKSAGESKKAPSALDGFSHPELWKPLRLMMVYVFFSNLLSGMPYTPYLVNVISLFGTSVDPKWATAVYTMFNIVGNVLTILLVHRLGKRFLVLTTIAVCSLAYLLIGLIGLYCTGTEFTSWTKLTLFFVSTFSSSLGIMPIGWILIGEVFPMVCKNLGSSICAATYFFLSFCMTKFYLDLEACIGFYNTFVLFGSLGFGSLVYFYFSLPETENKTLKEIAEQFAHESA